MKNNPDNKRWVVLAASCLVNLCIGSIYAWSVFSAPLAEKLTALLGRPLSAADLAIVFTVANSVGPITMISGGFINDKFGPRRVILLGGAMFGVGMILTGLARSLGGLIVSYGLVLGLGLGMAYGATISNCVKFFPDKRGLAGGIATAAYGLSSVIIPPVAQALITGVGIDRTFYILGGVFLVVILLSSVLITGCPKGYLPAGDSGSSAGMTKDGAGMTKDGAGMTKDGAGMTKEGAGMTMEGAGMANRHSGLDPESQKDWRGMLADPVFYVMLAMLLCGAFSGLMITSQASPMAQRMTGMTPALAATAVSVLALFNVGGRIVAGTLSDRFGRVAVLRGAFVVEIAGLALLFATGAGETFRFFAGVSLIGICFGALMGIYPGFTADQFGPRHNSVNYGIMFIGFALAGYFGPTVCRSLLASSGSYARAFVVAAVLALAGVMLSFVYRALAGRK